MARLARSASESLTTLGASSAAAAAGKVLAKTPLSGDAGGIGPRDAMQAFASVMSVRGAGRGRRPLPTPRREVGRRPDWAALLCAPQTLAQGLPGRGHADGDVKGGRDTAAGMLRHDRGASEVEAGDGGSGAAVEAGEGEEEERGVASDAAAHQTCGFFSPFAAFLEQYAQAWTEDAVASVQDRALGPMARLEAFMCVQGWSAHLPGSATPGPRSLQRAVGWRVALSLAAARAGRAVGPWKCRSRRCLTRHAEW